MTTLKELKELDAKATSAPWALSDRRSFDDSIVIKADDGLWIAKVCADGSRVRNCTEDEKLANSQITAAARNALPDLIRVIELAEEALEHCKMNVDWSNRNIEQALSEIRKMKGE